MEFNGFIWKLYRDSDEGHAAIARDVSDHLKYLKIAEDKAFRTECSYFEVFDDDLVENGIQGVEGVDLRDLFIPFFPEKRHVPP